MEPTVTPAATPSSVGIRYGLIIGVVSAILSVIQLSLFEDPETPFRWVGAIVAIVGIVLAHKKFKELNHGFMSYGQGLGIGTIVSAVGGLVSSVFSYLYMTFINPEYMTRVMELQRAKMEAKGLDDAQIDQALGMAQKFSGGPMIIVFGLIGAVFMGFIISLIISAFTKNTRPEFE
ncbi:DUF4199 domain-containing protein [Hymenobacter rigui]|uniref:DUF4199 domain-containing protein n=1 Tax=Hymenobacter rigui TaxID=334424 RepID=A0A3R9MUF0_9BACT|nr:DUF4199 domain-containing protein [Hymenobacter rigui]RSK48719.1 DUF4199 domain-containing protein [Hymenobacter rigui]